MTTTRRYETNNGQSPERDWMPLVDRATVLRSVFVAIVIGSVLTRVNQPGWVTGNDPLKLLPLLLAFLTPFAVVMISQVTAARRGYIDFAEHALPLNKESFVSTTISHGIPLRAVVIGLAFGSLNALMILADTLLRSGDLAAVSIATLSQAYVLPVLFGLLSQAISYRRSRYQVVKAWHRTYPEKNGH